MEHGKGLFYFCIERTQRDRIDTNLGAQALLGHTNSPIEKCRSHTTLADRLPRHGLRARPHAYVCMRNTVHPTHETISVLCIRWIRDDDKVDNFAIPNVRDPSATFGAMESHGRNVGEKSESFHAEGRAAKM